MASSLAPPEVAPVLSTPETHIFEVAAPLIDVRSLPKLSDEQLAITYEIERTVTEIRAGRWRRIALQFPDYMLVDSPRIFQALSRGLHVASKRSFETSDESVNPKGEEQTVTNIAQRLEDATLSAEQQAEKLFILGDTSYGSCCVDEVAAEHVDADVVVHYGRSCLSPTARLPVIYVFTTRPLSMDSVVETFKNTFPQKTDKVLLMADIPYTNHIQNLSDRLTHEGYTNVFATSVLHNPSSPLPNRTVPTDVIESKDSLREYQLFHISEPPDSLLLTLSSRVDSIYIYPTNHEDGISPKTQLASSAMALRRRYGLITSLTTADIFGILINTLSVKNYLHIVDHVREQIAAAGKKSYTFVVGKINAAKMANFSEIGGWVVIGCWESSLIESKEFWKPVITPFELQLALKGDNDRVWTGEWSSDFQAILTGKKENSQVLAGGKVPDRTNTDVAHAGDGDFDSEEESEPPEFDLRTGRYISHSRPMHKTRQTSPKPESKAEESSTSSAVAKRAPGDLAQIGGMVSPGAEFLRSKRTWQGLGSDFEISYDESEGSDRQGATLEEGRRGVARGYVVGDDRSLA